MFEFAERSWKKSWWSFLEMVSSSPVSIVGHWNIW